MASQAVTQAVTQAQSRLHGVEAKGGKDRLRLLSAMLDNLVPPGLENVAADINGCRDEAELRQLADHFITAVFKPSKSFSFLSFLLIRLLNTDTVSQSRRQAVLPSLLRRPLLPRLRTTRHTPCQSPWTHANNPYRQERPRRYVYQETHIAA